VSIPLRDYRFGHSRNVGVTHVVEVANGQTRAVRSSKSDDHGEEGDSMTNVAP
jgi:hypothetical protein